VLSFNGQELYRGALVAAVPIAAYADADSLRAFGSPTVRYSYAEIANGSDKAAEAGTDVLTGAVAQAMAPNARGQQLLGARFGIDAATAAVLFPLQDTAAAPVGAQLVGVTATRFSPAIGTNDVVLGAPEVLHNLFAGAAPSSLTVEWLFVPPGLDGAKEDPKSTLLSLQTALSLGGRTVVGDQQQAVLEISSVTAGAPWTRSDAAAVSCFADRFAALNTIARGTKSDVHQPAFSATSGACTPLAVGFGAALAGDAKATQIVIDQALATGVAIDYAGWDEALVAVAQWQARAGKDLHALTASTQLGRSVLNQAVGYVDGLGKKSAQLPAQVGDELIALGFSWALLGRTAAGLVDQIADAVSKAAAAYPASVAKMLDDLQGDWTAMSPGMSAVTCASGMTAAWQAALDGLVAKMLGSAPLAAMGANLRDQALQLCYSSDHIAGVDHAVDTAVQFSTADSKLSGDDIGFADSHRTLLEHAVTEQWTATNFQELGDIVQLLAADSFSCGAYRSVSSRAVCLDSQLQVLSAGRGLLQTAYGGRYGQLARDLGAEYQKGVPIEIRLPISRSFGDGTLWTTCGQGDFDTRKGQLIALLERAKGGSVSDVFTEIDGLLANCQ
jgi:hypothetical protein